MSSDIAIRVKNVGKCYHIYKKPQDRLKQSFMWGRKKLYRDFWALRDVSFEVKRGETVGIVGCNGSGKSTLLQIICSILTPTSGEVEVNGRVAALLELGSGFNKEFTGKENVYMNASILGLSRKEIDDCYGDIVSFADIGDFIDQPAKTYSSGMYMRLAFAVAINVEPDILIIDEALSVGDTAFQRKCFSRIKAIQERGGTILFVSHSASKVVELCSSAVLLDQGELLLNDTAKSVVAKYHNLLFSPPEKAESIRNEIRGMAKQRLCEPKKKGGGGAVPVMPKEITPKSFYDPNLLPTSTISYESCGALIENPRITTPQGENVNILIRGKEYIYTYDINFKEEAHSVRYGMMIKTTSGFELGGIMSHNLGDGIENIERGTLMQPQFRFRCSLRPGVYFLNSGVLGIVDGNEVFLHRLVDIAMFRVQPEKKMLITGIVDFTLDGRV